jgi:hypothetical protein
LTEGEYAWLSGLLWFSMAGTIRGFARVLPEAEGVVDVWRRLRTNKIASFA